MGLCWTALARAGRPNNHRPENIIRDPLNLVNDTLLHRVR